MMMHTLAAMGQGRLVAAQDGLVLENVEPVRLGRTLVSLLLVLLSPSSSIMNGSWSLSRGELYPAPGSSRRTWSTLSRSAWITEASLCRLNSCSSFCFFRCCRNSLRSCCCARRLVAASCCRLAVKTFNIKSTSDRQRTSALLANKLLMPVMSDWDNVLDDLRAFSTLALYFETNSFRRKLGKI